MPSELYWGDEVRYPSLPRLPGTVDLREQGSRRESQQEINRNRRSGRVCLEPLKIGGKVLIQNKVLGRNFNKWDEEGLVMSERETKYGSPQSYWVLTSAGRLKLRNRKYLSPFIMEEKDEEALGAQAVVCLSRHIARAVSLAVARYGV